MGKNQQCLFGNDGGIKEMGKYDYPSDELRSKDYAAYLTQKYIAQGYCSKLAEFERMAKYHAEQAKIHKDKSEHFKNLHEELKKDNE